jgi:hypothetical protein
MKKRSKALVAKLKKRKKRHMADSTSHRAPDPRDMHGPMANAMHSGSSSGRGTIASPSSGASGK